MTPVTGETRQEVQEVRDACTTVRRATPPCPDPACTVPHVVRNGTINGRQGHHYHSCRLRFGDPRGASPEEIGHALLAVMPCGSLRTAEETTGQGHARPSTKFDATAPYRLDAKTSRCHTVQHGCTYTGHGGCWCRTS